MGNFFVFGSSVSSYTIVPPPPLCWSQSVGGWIGMRVVRLRNNLSPHAQLPPAINACALPDRRALVLQSCIGCAVVRLRACASARCSAVAHLRARELVPTDCMCEL